MMNSGGLKAIAIAMITIGCLVATVMGVNPITTIVIGFLGVMAIDEL